ncbi:MULTISPECIES: RidA family protein [unclassified Bradyrhizobium]|uniref:RidA family protein n=1 Tax=unclassified Bradyrhizobium TaxID=2631580 RepID=UPI0028EBAC36|nr:MULTISPECIES: RidA family protein [unclassified Bradyrhizobium]
MNTHRWQTRIISSQAPTPLGHYAQGVLNGDTLYVSGQLGVAKDTPSPESVAVADQVTYALSNIEAIARTVGASRAQVVKATIYVTDIALWGEANKAYAAFFGDHKPARSVVPCPELHLGAKIEIEAIVAVA